MNRDEALSMVLAEAFAENGVAMLAHEGQDPGHRRMETLISAINFLADDLSAEDHFSRTLVSALFTLGHRVPEDFELGNPSSESRSSLFQQLGDLVVAITHLIENWDHWPDPDQLTTYVLDEPSAVRTTASAADEECEGYRVGDVTYCIIPDTEETFPVRVVRLGFNLIEVEPLDADFCQTICAPFLADRANRCFRAPRLRAAARFGGFDERPVNSDRTSGPELRLLPSHYATKTGDRIKELHASDPDSWPLPTGRVFERSFQDAESKSF